MRRSPRNLRIACNHRGLTHFGGAYFFHRFVQVLQLRHFLAQNLKYPRRNRRYCLSHLILALIYPLSSVWIASRPRLSCVPTAPSST